jgi:uncharacterized membrane protein
LLENFQVLFQVQPDGALLVQETIQPRFTGAYNGIYRTIPIEYRTSTGFGYKLLVHLESVTDEAGYTLKCETSYSGGYLKYKIWLPGAQDATKTVILRYRVENAVRFFADHDELYWNVTGNEWPVPIEKASAVVELPPAAAGAGLHAVAYTGPAGSAASDATVEVTGNRVMVRTTHGLSYKEGLTVVAGWDKGVVAEPTLAMQVWRFLLGNWFFVLPVLAFALMFYLWYTRGRDPRPDQAVMVRYEPPEQLTPGELGTLIDNKPDLRDITATLVDLAVRGYLRIEEQEHKVLLWTKHDYLFRLLKSPAQWGELKEHERKLLLGLFNTSDQAGADVKLSELQNRFYAHLPGIREAIFKELIKNGCYTRNPAKVKGLYVGLGIGTFAVMMVGLLIYASRTGASPLSAILAAASTGVIIILFALIMPARTLRGAQTRIGIKGFEEFLERAEKDHIERLQGHPELFDKYLPFAMALGVERRWTHAFENIYLQPPDWYHGTYASGFRPLLLLNGLNAFNHQAFSTLASSPRSSSGSSGFGGGGSSGGGFGGGGGGAF